jgi:hypothetical protein
MPEGQYPDNWKEITDAVEARSGGRCECTGECGLHRGVRCQEIDGEPAMFANGKVVLTTAHRNHCKSDCRMENLIDMCNTCHLRMDNVLHMRNAFETKRNGKAIKDMFVNENEKET